MCVIDMLRKDMPTNRLSVCVCVIAAALQTNLNSEFIAARGNKFSWFSTILCRTKVRRRMFVYSIKHHLDCTIQTFIQLK